MPRLSPSLLRRAAARNPLLPRLLRECRDLPSAENELRWLEECAERDHNVSSPGPRAAVQHRLRNYVSRRSQGEPLQYILGNQPFGELEILCRPGILIPRPETENYTTELAKLINSALQEGHLCRSKQLAIADLCTGSGCIALLLHSILRSVSQELKTEDAAPQPVEIQIVGADISSIALELAEDNLGNNVSSQTLHDCAMSEVQFRQLDILALGREAAAQYVQSATDAAYSSAHDHGTKLSPFLSQRWPVIVSNPPYIGPHDYAPGGNTARSVREYEPKLALVPPEAAIEDYRRFLPKGQIEQADVFYLALLHIAQAVKTELLLMEVGDLSQAIRVVELTRQILQEQRRADAMHEGLTVIELWRDDGSVNIWDESREDHGTFLTHSNHDKNKPSTRAVAVWRGKLAEWRKAKS